MSEISPEHRWWENEPPETSESEEEFPCDDRRYDTERDIETLDGASRHELFTGAIVTQDSEGLKFHTPTRLVVSPEHGTWFLDVKGERRWFKERDDYGEMRVSSNGLVFWIPHLYPFEDTDDQGLPLILDRERCEVRITLLKGPDEGDLKEPFPTDILIESLQSSYYAQEDIEFHNPFGMRYFTRFTDQARSIQPEEVVYPSRKWATLLDYLYEIGKPQDYNDIMQGNIPYPEEFHDQDNPENWSVRRKHDVIWPAFGTMWVPVDVLRAGTADATIQFPMFQISQDLDD